MKYMEKIYRTLSILWIVILLIFGMSYPFILQQASVDFSNAVAAGQIDYLIKKNDFFSDCLRHEPKYKCDILWKELE